MYDVAERLPHAARRSGRGRGRRAAPAHRDPGAALRRGARRRPRSPTSSAVIDNLLGKADRLLIGGGMVLHLPRGPGPRGRQEPARGGPGRHRAGATSPSRGARRRDRAADRHRGRRRVLGRRRRTTSCPPTRSRPTGWAWTSAPSRRGCSPSALADARTVFWNGPMGVVRDGAVRRGHPCRRRRRSPRPRRALTVVGGGDSAAAVRQLGFAETRSGTSPPVAARAWSTSRARACPA